MLRAPSFDCVAEWRAQQEAGLDRTAPGAAPPMDSAALTRFVAHYERLTRWMIADAPADLVCDIAEDRTPLRYWSP
jgi:D-glycerate 3-kinase